MAHENRKLTISYVTRNSVIEIGRLQGFLMGGAETTRFHGHIHECLDRGILRYCLNLSQVEWMNSVGLGMLISALTIVKAKKGQLVLCAIPKDVMATLEITRLKNVFTLHETEGEALRALQS